MEQERKYVELWARAFQHNFSRVQQEISQNLTMAAREIQKYEEVPDSLSRLILEAESAAITNDFVQKEIILAQDLFNIPRSEEHTSELQSRGHLVCSLLLEQKNQ